jgi:tRNA A-37 threonylcarbamoyl transferase component Bud32/tetratricopeptide (TPR) repeat protein/Cdc6-like AAA superfamily ATPase
MGTVYRAVDTRLNRIVAVKVWRPSEGKATGSTRRMLQEARAASALNHPNIVIVHEFGETPEGDAFIVQEFIEGRTLRDCLGDPMPLAEAMDIGTQVARALGAAHAAGVVHRDIKPENVMVRPDGYVKVLDFGIAHLPQLASGTGSILETLADNLIGTPAYMPPEMMLGGTIGPAADMFALGVLVYEMVTGKQPFEAPTVLGMLARIATDTPVPMRTLDPSVPPGLEAFVQSMLSKSPERRPDASEVEKVLPAFATPADPAMGPQLEAPAYAVGREAPLRQLGVLYERVRSGHSVIVGVTGEPGIGKSTVLEAFMVELQKADERPTLVRVRCSENLAGSEAYLPVLEALEDLRSRARSSFDALMRSVAPTWHAQLVATDGNGATAAASPDRMKRELRAFLSEASRRAPLVWLIEDLHWADVSTIDILNYVADRFDDTRMLMVVAFRPTDMSLVKHPFLALRSELQRKGVYEEIALGFLTRDDVARYLSLRWPSNNFPAAFVEDIHSRTEGSPLFMADLVRYLHDTGAIVETDGTWGIGSAHFHAGDELPESVRAMIARKIERVEEADRKLLLAASVQGQEFDSAPLAEAVAMDAAVVEERLEALHHVHGFVQRGDELEYPDGALTLRYRFVHVLYQNVLYASLQPSRRIALCGSTARALAAHYVADASQVAGRLAVLFEAARDFASAGQYFYVAAQRAASLFGFREALTLAERGLARVARLPDGAARRQLELALQMTRALALRFVKGWAAPELEPTFVRARQLCAELDDPPALVPVMWNVALFNMLRGDLALVQQQVVPLTAKAEASGESAFVMSACHIDGVLNEFMGPVQRSMELLERARELHDPARHGEYSAMFGMDPGMVARAMSARTLWAAGYPDRALVRGQETIALSKSQRQPVTLVFALLIIEGVHVYRGEAAEAIALGEQVEAMCEEYEFAQEREWGRAFQGAAYSLAGDVDRGAEQLRRSIDGQIAIRSSLVRSMWLSLLAEAFWRVGRVHEGLSVVDDAFAYADSAPEGGYVHELHRLRGELLLKDNRIGEAEASLRNALAYAKRMEARSFELRAATSLARFLAANGRPNEGRDLLAPVLGWFTEGHGTADLAAARTLLTTIGNDQWE